MIYLIKKSYFLTAFLFAVFQLSATTSIDLNQQDIFVRQGFEARWVGSLPVENNAWKLIPGKNGPRSLVVRNLGFNNIPKHSFLSFATYSEESFTFITSFHMDKPTVDSFHGFSLFLKGIGYNWEIYLNGVSIEKEIHFNKNGDFSPVRGHQLIISLPHELIRGGENILTYHIIGDPTFYGTGFYYGEPYLISLTADLYPFSFSFFSISSFAVYFVFAIIWLYLFLRQRKQLLYLSFSFLAFVFAIYSAERAFVEVSSGVFDFLSFRIEYVSIFSISLMFVLVVNTYLKNKITMIIKGYCAFCGLLVLFSIWASPNIVLDFLRMWQLTLPLSAGYLLSLSIRCYTINNNSNKKFNQFIKDWNQIPVQELMFFSICLSILLFSVFIDVMDSLYWKKALFFSKYGFLFCMSGIAGLLFNRFIHATEKVEIWSEELEKEVLLQTKRLRETKNSLETVFSTSGDGIARMSLDLMLETYNKAYQNMFGFSKKELEYIKLNSFCDEENIQIIMESRKKLLIEGVVSFRIKSKRKDGNIIDLSVTSSLLRDSHNAPSGIIVNIKNITKEVEAEEKLLASKKNLEAIFNALPDLYFRVDENGTYLEYHGPENLLYKGGETIIGSTISSRLPKSVAEKVMSAIQEVLSDQKRITIEYELEIDNEPRIFEAAMLPFHKKEIISGVRDITDRRKTEKNLQKSEEQYRLLVENMEDIVFIINNDRRILFVNQSLIIFSSKQTSELIGESVSSLFKEKGTPIISETLNQIFESSEGEKIDVELDFSRFSLWFEFSLIPQFNTSNSLESILCIGREITEKRLQEQGLMQSVENLRVQRQQLRDLSKEMLLIQEKERKHISMELHDAIGQAMTAISLTLESIRTSDSNEKTIKSRIADCQNLVEETSEKIHHFSEELHPPGLEDLGLIPVIKSHSRKFTERTGLLINVEGDEKVETLSSDVKTILFRIYQEGINNIAKHANASLINITLNKQNGNFHCCIEDNGQGFDFNLISSTSSGLGLVGMTERIISIGGSLDIQSSPGGGTRLFVEIPKKYDVK